MGIEREKPTYSCLIFFLIQSCARNTAGNQFPHFPYFVTMKNCLSILVLLLAFQATFAQFDEGEIDQLIAEHAGWGGFTGVILLAENGEIGYQKAFYPEYRKDSDPITLDSKFRICSITKAFTAILVMRLWEQGLLKPEDPISEHLPEIGIKTKDQVTIHDLLLHTSGFPEDAASDYAEEMSAGEMVAKVFDGSRPYGTQGEFNYNNIDFRVLELIIEKVSGKSFEKALQEQILDPLHMDNSGLLHHDKLPNGLVKGYHKDEDGRFSPESDYRIENYGAAGAMYSTLEDLMKLDRALQEGSLLKQATLDKMQESHPELGYVGYGAWTYNYPFIDSQPFTWERRGGIRGFAGVFVRFPEADKTLIILSNSDFFNPDTFGQTDGLKERLMIRLFEE